VTHFTGIDRESSGGPLPKLFLACNSRGGGTLSQLPPAGRNKNGQGGCDDAIKNDPSDREAPGSPAKSAKFNLSGVNFRRAGNLK